MDPSHALSELEEQHRALRVLMERCEQLADQVDAERAQPEELTREIARLRLAFDAHNAFEEQLLRPVLRAADAFADVRIDRMVEDHVGEHRAVQHQLGGGVTSELRIALESLRAHLESEERYFLSARVLRDDLVSVEGGG